MPNHLLNRLAIVGPAASVEAAVALCGEPFRLHNVVPMPASLDIASGGWTEIGYYVLTERSYDRMPAALVRESALRFLGLPQDATREQIVAALTKVRPDALDLGRRAAANIAEHGHPTWYEWRRVHWGTKWDTYEPREAWVVRLRRDGAVARCAFTTANSPPVPVPALVAVGRRFPDLTLHLWWLDEGALAPEYLRVVCGGVVEHLELKPAPAEQVDTVLRGTG